jgi:Fur family ferric uptake transcriptional regulator
MQKQTAPGAIMNTEPTDADLRDTLRSAGLRATAARVAVLRLLHGSAAPSSHPEVFAALAEDGWDRATLYRNLVDLAEAGILRRVDLGDHLWRYELRSAPEAHHRDVDHPHFLCTTCGELACLPPMSLPAQPPGRVPHAMISGDVAIQFRGVCDRCQAAPSR